MAVAPTATEAIAGVHADVHAAKPRARTASAHTSFAALTHPSKTWAVQLCLRAGCTHTKFPARTGEEVWSSKSANTMEIRLELSTCQLRWGIQDRIAFMAAKNDDG